MKKSLKMKRKKNRQLAKSNSSRSKTEGYLQDLPPAVPFRCMVTMDRRMDDAAVF